ncbi:M56 family metallopeptidase [Kitasatospora viridis]|uniref:Peptidase M48-like protein n=1 Tax=Kitasatospora viridis TaxID=281105 RepID=A0A561ULG2_9ACTN|nr:M56 family metallopeptidase [Kitasatospora viridis]TWG00190.1 peptidase M48-like protein [Kitasatospora viridis]
MTVLLLLAGYGTVLGTAAPRWLARARWVARAPRTAVVLWAGLWLGLAGALAMTAHVLSEPGHLAGPTVHWLARDAEQTVEGPAGHWRALLLGAAVLGAAGAVVATGWLRAARARARHRLVLDLVARQEAGAGWWTVPDERAAAWCVPGRGGRIVFSSGAVALLDPAQRSAVLAHERAHLRGRHHLLSGAAGALARALPGLPLARAAAEQVALLVEMAADDRALRQCAPRTLATALYTVAAGRAPGGALAAGEVGAVARVHRLLAAAPPLSAPRRVGCWALAGLLPALPVLLACGP